MGLCVFQSLFHVFLMKSSLKEVLNVACLRIHLSLSSVCVWRTYEIDCLVITCNKKPLACLECLGNVLLMHHLSSGQLSMSWVRALQIVQASALELATATYHCQVISTGKSSGKKGEGVSLWPVLCSPWGEEFQIMLQLTCWRGNVYCGAVQKRSKESSISMVTEFPEFGLGLGTWPVLIVLKKAGNSCFPFPEMSPSSHCESVVCPNISGWGRGVEEWSVRRSVNFKRLHL